MEALSWQALGTFTGLAAFLSLVVLPLAKRWGATGRTTLVIGYLAAFVFAGLAAIYTSGLQLRPLLDALLTAILAAMTSNGAYQVKKAVKGELR